MVIETYKVDNTTINIHSDNLPKSDGELNERKNYMLNIASNIQKQLYNKKDELK